MLWLLAALVVAAPSHDPEVCDIQCQQLVEGLVGQGFDAYHGSGAPTEAEAGACDLGCGPCGPGTPIPLPEVPVPLRPCAVNLTFVRAQVRTDGDAAGFVALSGQGDATCQGPACLAASVAGDGACASAGCSAASVLGDARGELVAASGFGHASSAVVQIELNPV